MEVIRCDLQTSYGRMFEAPFEPTEIHQGIQAGGWKKAPGNDGIGRESYSHSLTIVREDLCDVINQMFCAGTSRNNKNGE